MSLVAPKSTTRLAPKSTTTEFLKLLDKIVSFLNSSRSDAAFSKYVNDAAALATNLYINVEFPFVAQKVGFFDHECTDKETEDPKLSFKFQFHLKIVDAA
ncbi:hypothetical protein AVEN_4953-1 [Araneus ventricosus]|uniref:Uncharacterized protein n=1 Tax=Araneus ventricosus TaxID=182803 RepID=A0A4Y2E4X6_ARAVE|nr:hypothetical protein AVEN_4953-1 [Araneus ventricosus]